MNLLKETNDTFIIFINEDYLILNKEEKTLYDSIKKILITLKKRYALNIYGYFETIINYIPKIGTIIYFNKIDDDNLNINIIDLKIIFKEKDCKLKFKDYFLIKDYENIEYKNNNYLIKTKDIKKENIIKLADFYSLDIEEIVL